MFRLVRGTGHVLDVLHRVQVAPRIHDGAFSVDLTARHPRARYPAAAYEPKLDVDFTPLREQDLTAAGLGQAA
ncbi:hypothetical protein ACFYOR_17045 [Streptomyces griseofuscus]|uniref:hypothetical protein n=1 Tax=Streptomyces griseofuscus TaxID=146922 RepID=UPI00369F7F5A